MFSHIKKKKVNGIIFRSNFEIQVCKPLIDKNIFFEYESLKIPFVIPQSLHNYVPDVVLYNGIILEIKGLLTLANREKHMYIRKQFPELDIRFILQNSKTKLYKGSKTTYAKWLDKNKFLWAEKEIPISWINEKPENKNSDYMFLRKGKNPIKHGLLNRFRTNKLRGRK